MRTGLLLSTALLVGCATPTTGIVPRGDGLYTVTRQGDGFWVTTESLKTAALLEAGQHCETSKRSLKVIHIKEIPAGVLGRWPEAEVLFSCPEGAAAPRHEKL